MAEFASRSRVGSQKAVNKSDLLNELRIDKTQREDHGAGARWPLIAGALALLIVLLGAAAWYFLPGAKPFEVEAATASAPSANGGDTAVLQATGYVTARREATVSAQITGTLTDVMIEEGDHVQEGQVLAHLDSTAQQAQLAQAQAGAQAAQALLAQYQAQLAQNRRDLTRAQDLVARKLVSVQSVELARTQVETQAAQVTAQRRQVEVAQANVRSAQVQLDYCTVRAPFAGVIIAKAAQVGEIVSPFSAGGGFTRTGVGTIVDMDSLEIEVDVNEAYINRVQPGQQAQRGARRLSGLADSGACDRDHSDRGSQQGHGQGAHRSGDEGCAHPARHGRARVVSRRGAERRRRLR